MKATKHPTSRRAVLAGLAAAPVATLPGLANGAPSPSPELIALFEEFQMTHAAFERSDEGNTFDFTAEAHPLFDRLCAIADCAARIPARSLADVVVKLRLHRRWHMGRSLHEPGGLELWDMQADGWSDGAEHSLLAIARDIHRLATEQLWRVRNVRTDEEYNIWLPKRV